MANPLTSARDSLPDHMSPSGDLVAWAYTITAHTNTLPLTLTVSIYTSGALSVSGHINDEVLADSLLDHAMDAIRGYHNRLDSILLQGKDASLPVACNKISIEGPVSDRMYAIACMQSAKSAIKDMHARRNLTMSRPLTLL